MEHNNKNLGRQKELVRKLKLTCDRYESVFDKPLTVDELEYFLDEEWKRDRLSFLRDRMGQLSQTDIIFLRDHLKRSTTSKELPPELNENLEEIEDGETEEDAVSF